MISAAQLSPTQDYSIRFWFSSKPNGIFVPNNFSFFHMNRFIDKMYLYYDTNVTLPPADQIVSLPTMQSYGPANIFPIPLQPGSYFLNFLNLVNAENIFSFSSTVVEV